MAPRKPTSQQAGLLENYRKLASLMAHLPGMAFHALADENRTLTFISAGCHELTGLASGRLVGEGAVPFFELVHPEDREVLQHAVAQALDQNRPWRLEYRLNSVEGVPHWVWEQGAGVNNTKGELCAIEGFITDITEKKRFEEALWLSETKHRCITEHTTDLTLLLNEKGAVNYINPALARTLRTDLDHALGEDFMAWVHPTDKTDVKKVLARTRQKPDHTYTLPHFRLKSRGEGYINLEGAFTGIPGQPDVGAVVVNAREITERLRAEEALRKSEERYALAIRGANDGLWDWDLVSHRLFLSPRFQAMLGLPERPVTTTPMHWLSRIHDDDRERMQEQTQAHLSGARPYLEVEYRIRHEDGSWRWVLTRGLAVRGPEGQPVRMAGSQTDIHERKRAERQLFFDAFHDPLTQLPNRSLFMDRLNNSLKRSKRRKDYQFAVLFLDLDRFKVINDSLGHMAGDQLLITIAGRLKDCLRTEDTLARLGGDEFVVLLEEIGDVKGAVIAAERLQDSLSEPVDIGGQEVFSTVSIGIAVSRPDYQRAEDLLRDADIALYRAKRAGKARHAIFDKTMHEKALAQLQMETALRRGMAREEFRVYFQPIVRLGDGALVGFEALVRWERPGQGLTLPGQFIPLTEETGLVSALGLWVMKEALTQLRSWRMTLPQAEPLYVSVNLSGRQLLQQELSRTVEEMLIHTGVPAGCLRLEITESAVMGVQPEITENLHALKDLGVRLFMDDFGTGFSSLSYLHQLPIDTIKIDRSFVARLNQKEQGQEIVRAIIEMARSLRLGVVAEGVETETQRDQLMKMGCENAQGYWFSEPLPAGTAVELVKHRGPLKPRRYVEGAGGA